MSIWDAKTFVFFVFFFFLLLQHHFVTKCYRLTVLLYFRFSFILSKSRCPVLTAGLRIYLTKENCMFNNKKLKKDKKLEKMQKKENEKIA